MGLEEGYKMQLDYMGQEGGAMLWAPALLARGPVWSFASYQKLCLPPDKEAGGVMLIVISAILRSSLSF